MIPLRRVDAGIAVAVTSAALLVFAFVQYGVSSKAGFRFLQNIELRSLDSRFGIRGARPHDERIVIVGLDEKTLQKVGAFPIPRDAYAHLVDQLSKGGAKVIAFDENFPKPEKNSAVDALKKLEQQVAGAPPSVMDKIRELEATSDNDKTFAAAIKRADNVILGHLFLDPSRNAAMTQQESEEYYNALWARPFPWMQMVQGGRKFDPTRAWEDNGGIVATGVYANITLLSDAAKSFGFFDFVPDSDGTYRHAPLLIRYRDREWFPSLAVQTIREFEDIKDQSIAGYLSENGMERMELGEHIIQTGRDGTVLINYTGPYNTYAHYSMADVIDGTVPAETFRGKIVLFGATALAIGDIRNTPFRKEGQQEYMGVEMHANVLDNILHTGERGRGFLSRGYREEGIDVMFILLFGLGMGWVFGRAKPLQSTVSLVIVLALFVLIVQATFSWFGMWLTFVIPAGTLVANYASITSFRMIFEEREKRKVRKTFERYVSPGVIALIEKDPQKYFKTGGESKELTVMFSDIRSFTTISEGLTPNQLVSLLNEYLGDMTDILFKRWGTLDKYIGDAIMGFWGSPFPQDDHASRSCACALDMRARLEELNMKWEAEGKNPLSIGVGLNTGEVNVGNMGSSKRFAWTVMGDNVNLASRLEGITKEYHVQCVVSESTYAAAKEQYVFRELDKIRVKGKLLPVTIYELVDWKHNEAKHTERLARFSEALTAYRRQQFADAAELFAKMLERWPEDGPAEVFWKRSLEYAADSPEASWDGVYVMKTK